MCAWNAGNSAIKVECKKKVCMQKVLIFKKKQRNCSLAGFEPATSWMQVSCFTHWAIWLWFSLECCSSFLHFFIFNPLQNAIWSPHLLAVTNLKKEDDGFMLGSWYVDVSGPGELTAWRTDRRTAFQLYIYRCTASFRSDNLFLPWIGKHEPITSSTIARWLRTCLQEAGTDTDAFKAHSVRGAAYSTGAWSGVTISDIFNAADWSSETTF